MNYARKLVSIFLCLLIFAFSFAACGSSGEAADKGYDRFYMVEDVSIYDLEYPESSILVDRETGVCYLFVYGNTYTSGLTVLLDADGKPLIWEDKR